MDQRRAWIAIVVCGVLGAGDARAQAPGGPPDLDAVAQRVIADERVAGASVLVMQRGKLLLHKGYGQADLEVEAAARPDTVYHVVGPMLPFTGVAVMQLVERGKLALDDDVARHLPAFPLQGRRVTIRQLLNHTSGIVDYHYLGDPIEATGRLPKALDEVMALYAGRTWVNEPGKKWDWSISGFQLLVMIVERASGEPFADYVARHIVAPAGVTATTYCDDRAVVRGLAHSYRHAEGGFAPAHEIGSAYNADLRFCSTVTDLYRLWKAITEKPLVKPRTFAQMSTPEGAAQHTSAKDPDAAYGFAMVVNREASHRRIGQHGSLFGYSGALYDFPDDGLTVVVLTNTEGQNAYAIARALARAVLGLAPLPARPAPPAERALVDAAVPAAERARVTGTFVLRLDHVTDGLHDSFAQYRRTYRVFDDNGRLMLQALGESPERLLRQPDGSFAIRSQPAGHITFAAGSPAASLKLEPSDFGVALVGERVGPGDPATFHRGAGS